jgi:hypothetical protein
MMPFKDQPAVRLAAKAPASDVTRASRRRVWARFLLALLRALSVWAA